MTFVVLHHLLLGSLAAIVYIAATVDIGLIINHYTLNLRARSLTLLLAVVIGLAINSVWLNTIGRFVSWQFAVWSWLALTVAMTPLAMRLWRQTIVDANWRFVKIGLLITIPCLAVYSALSPAFDELWHLGIASIVANNGWPIQFPYDPSQPFAYHYGFDLLAAALVTLTAYPQIAHVLLEAVLQSTVLLLGAVYIRSFSLSTKKILAATALWFLAESIGWVVRPWRHLLPTALQHLPPFTSMMVHSVGLSGYAKSELIAVGVLLTLLIIKKYELRISNRFLLLSLPVLLAAASISSETILLTVLGLVALIMVIELPKRMTAVILIPWILICVVITYFQNGLVTNLIDHHLRQTTMTNTQTIETTLVLRNGQPLTLFGNENLPLEQWSTWWRLFLEMGPQIFLLSLALINFKRWNRLEKTALVGSALSLTIPIVCFYPATPVNILRFFHASFIVGNLLGAVVLTSWLRLGWQWLIYICLIIGGAIAFLFSAVPGNRIVPIGTNIIDSFSLAPLRDYFLAQQFLPPGSVLWTSYLKNAESTWASKEDSQIAIIFGAYLRNCTAYSLRRLNTTCNAFYTVPTIDTLRALKVTHLLLTQEWQQRHKDSQIFQQLFLEKKFVDVQTPLFDKLSKDVSHEPVILYRVIH